MHNNLMMNKYYLFTKLNRVCPSFTLLFKMIWCERLIFGLQIDLGSQKHGTYVYLQHK